MEMSKPASGESRTPEAPAAPASGTDEPVPEANGPEPNAAEPEPTAPPEPQSPSAVYSVSRWVGGLDHLTIIKADRERGYCVSVHLAAPASGPKGDVEVPAPWSLMQVTALPSGDGCTPNAAGGTAVTPKRSVSARGSIAWRKVAAQGQPCSIDIDLAVTFEASGSIPASDRLFAEDLRLECP